MVVNAQKNSKMNFQMSQTLSKKFFSETRTDLIEQNANQTHIFSVPSCKPCACSWGIIHQLCKWYRKFHV